MTVPQTTHPALAMYALVSDDGAAIGAVVAGQRGEHFQFGAQLENSNTHHKSNRSTNTHIELTVAGVTTQSGTASEVRPMEAANPATAEPGIAQQTGITPIPSRTTFTPSPAKPTPISWTDILFWSWLGGLTLLGGYVLATVVRLE